MNGLLLAAALVWLPPQSFTQWSKVDAFLRARPEAKLTIALTPAMATPLAKSALEPWIKQGRVEVAARIPGDPVLPLVAAHPAAPRPDDAVERAAEAREALEKRLGIGPAGFVPGAGELDPSLVGPLGASGAPWVLVGPYDQSASSWAAEGRAVFVPARAAAGAAPTPDELSISGVLVADESAAEESAIVPALPDLFKQARPEHGFVLVSEFVRSESARFPASGVASWPGWDGVAPAPPMDDSALAAWRAYGEAAKALERYQNSGAADMKVLDEATAELRKAQDARFFRAPAPGSPAGLQPDFRAALLGVYKKMKAPAPDSLYQGAASNAATAAADQPTGVKVTSGPNWVGFDNPAGTVAKAPAGVANADAWRLRGLRVEWNDQSVTFRLFPSRVEDPSPLPRPVYDVYIDLNHVLGAGKIKLLDGRGAFAQARDAWEFCLSLVGGDATLWRAGPGDPDKIAVYKAALDASSAEIRVSVPRASLRGNPARWGYVVLALAEDPARPGQAPSAILVGADGAQTLGVLGPLEQQKAVLDHPGTPQRVTAVRVETTPRL